MQQVFLDFLIVQIHLFSLSPRGTGKEPPRSEFHMSPTRHSFPSALTSWVGTLLFFLVLQRRLSFPLLFEQAAPSATCTLFSAFLRVLADFSFLDPPKPGKLSEGTHCLRTPKTAWVARPLSLLLCTGFSLEIPLGFFPTIFRMRSVPSLGVEPQAVPLFLAGQCPHSFSAGVPPPPPPPSDAFPEEITHAAFPLGH